MLKPIAVVLWFHGLSPLRALFWGMLSNDTGITLPYIGNIHSQLCMSKETLGFCISYRVLDCVLAYLVLGHSTRVSFCLHCYEMWSGGGQVLCIRGLWRENLSVVG